MADSRHQLEEINDIMRLLQPIEQDLVIPTDIAPVQAPPSRTVDIVLGKRSSILPDQTHFVVTALDPSTMSLLLTYGPDERQLPMVISGKFTVLDEEADRIPEYLRKLPCDTFEVSNVESAEEFSLIMESLAQNTYIRHLILSRVNLDNFVNENQSLQLSDTINKITIDGGLSYQRREEEAIQIFIELLTHHPHIITVSLNNIDESVSELIRSASRRDIVFDVVRNSQQPCTVDHTKETDQNARYLLDPPYEAKLVFGTPLLCRDSSGTVNILYPFSGFRRLNTFLERTIEADLILKELALVDVVGTVCPSTEDALLNLEKILAYFDKKEDPYFTPADKELVKYLLKMLFKIGMSNLDKSPQVSTKFLLNYLTWLAKNIIPFGEHLRDTGIRKLDTSKFLMWLSNNKHTPVKPLSDLERLQRQLDEIAACKAKLRFINNNDESQFNHLLDCMMRHVAAKLKSEVGLSTPVMKR